MSAIIDLVARVAIMASLIVLMLSFGPTVELPAELLAAVIWLGSTCGSLNEWVNVDLLLGTIIPLMFVLLILKGSYKLLLMVVRKTFGV